MTQELGPDPVMTKQLAADAEREARRQQSSASMVLKEPSVGLHDAREALFGIPSDVFGNDPSKRSLRAAFTHGDRLRGLGVLCLAVGVITLLLDSVVT